MAGGDGLQLLVHCAGAVKMKLQEQPQVAGDLLADLRLMYNNPKFSDVTFVCKDGERVPACRLFLAARSSMLSCMLTNGMAESRKDVIYLPEVSAPILLSVLEFLYTGATTSLSWKLALELVVAARYFLLESLETAAWTFLTDATSGGRDMTVMEAAVRLSEALEFSDLWKSSRSGILLAMVKVLKSGCGSGCGQDVAHLRFLSEQAFRYFLEQTRSDDASLSSVATYLRLRQITLWCASQLTPPGDGAIITCLPNPQSLSSFLQAQDMDEAGKCTKLDGEVRVALALSLEPWLPMVDLRGLDPVLLMKVVKPLRIIPPSVMRKLLEFHVLERARELGDEGREWDQNARLMSIDSSGCVITKAEGSCFSEMCSSQEGSIAYTYITLRVSRDADLQDQIGRAIYFDLVDHNKVPRFRMHNKALFSQFKERVAKEFGVPAICQRFWVWGKRVNKTYRPCRPLSDKEESQTVHQVQLACCIRSEEMDLFLDVQTLNGVPRQPAQFTARHILLFLKLYSPEKEELRYGGRIFVRPSQRPLDIREALIHLAGLAENDTIVLYQEMRFAPAVTCELIDQESTFFANQIHNGDIICYQKAPSRAEERSLPYPNLLSFLNHVWSTRHVSRSQPGSISSSVQLPASSSSLDSSSGSDSSSSDSSFSSGYERPGQRRRMA